MNGLAPQIQTEYRLRVIDGPDRGATFRLLAARVSIGRGSENDIQLKDLTVSRQHALIEMTQMGVLVKNMSDRSPIQVNGEEHNEAFLNPEDVIQMGATRIAFEVVSNQAHAVPQLAPAGLGGAPAPSPRLRKTGFAVTAHAPRGKLTFYLIVGGLALGVFWLLNTGSGGKKPMVVGGDTDIEKRLDEIRKRDEDARKAREQSGVRTQDFRKAQADFLRGRRDYENGLFSRALDALNSCLTHFPQHEQCRRYVTLATRRLDQAIQNDMRLGREHYENQKYRECYSVFNRLLFVIADEEDKRYQEAMRYRDICSQFFEEAF